MYSPKNWIVRCGEAASGPAIYSVDGDRQGQRPEVMIVATASWFRGDSTRRFYSEGVHRRRRSLTS